MDSAVLTAQSLSKKYANKTVVSDVGFTLHAGEILGLLGPNGAGKSTTVGMLYGVVTPDRGEISLGGYDLIRQGKRARKLLGVVPQEDSLDTDLLLRTSLLTYASYYGMSQEKAEQRVDSLLQQFGLVEYSKRHIETLSGGLKRRLALARALISEPKVIFLDEPTTGLDPDARQDFWRQILEIRDRGCAILLTTHYMDEAERLCDRIILLQDGKSIDSGTPEELIIRHVGKEVLEIAGLEEKQLQQIAGRHQTWCRRFAEGFLLGVPSEAIWQETMELMKTHIGVLKVNRRRGSLEDVFLSLTGASLS